MYKFIIILKAKYNKQINKGEDGNGHKNPSCLLLYFFYYPFLSPPKQNPLKSKLSF